MKKNKYTPAETALLRRISNNIKRYRMEMDISQEDLADMSKMDRTYIGNIERCETNPTVLKLKKVADALKVDVAEFFKIKNK
jgi:transcriptional regulator with XRE-family HTH domain